MLPAERLLEAVRRFDPQGAPALSLYLFTDPARAAGLNLDAQLRGLLRPLAERAAGAGWTEAFERDAARAREAVAGLDRPPRGMAIFSCASRDFLAVLPLALRFAPAADYGDMLYLRPLLTALDEHERTLVVVLDKERARFFHVFLGEIEELSDLVDYVPNRHAQGGYSQRKIQRDHDLHVHWHARHVADELADQVRRQPLDRILVGGPDEAVAELLRLLPPRFGDRVAPLPGVSWFSEPPAVLHAAMARAEQVEREREVALVASLREAVGTGRACTGVADVVGAVSAGSVAVLVFARGLQLPGGRCAECDALTPGTWERACPVCGTGALERVDDVLDHLIARVTRQGGRVEEVRGSAAERLGEDGGLAALLRYPVSAASPAATG